jgi:hypothetical protein
MGRFYHPQNAHWIMVVTVISLGAVGLVWYSLSWLSVLSNVFQIDRLVWLFFTLCTSNWVSLWVHLLLGSVIKHTY